MIKKRLIQIVSILLVLLITITIMPITSNAATYHIKFNPTYDSRGNQIRSSKQIGKLHGNMAEDMFEIGGRRAYCIELNTGCDTSSNYVQYKGKSASKIWTAMGYDKQFLIKLIMCCGLEGLDEHKATSKTVNGHKLDFYTINGIKATEHEIYIATQLLIWEVTEGYRSISRYAKFKLKNDKYNLSKAYSSTIQKVYNSIMREAINLNQIPSFTSSAGRDIKTYNFKVNHTTSGYRIASSDRVLTDNNKVLENYSSLASNKSVKFTYGKDVRYLNVTAKISNNTLTLHPQSVTSRALYNTGNVIAKEQNVPSIAKRADLITYGEANGQKDIQDLVGGCTNVDPVYAYYKVGVDFDSSDLSKRNFRVKKDMRISGDSSSIADSLESGYYYYVSLPDADAEYEKGKTTSYKYYDSDKGSIETGTTYSQLANKELGLNTSSRVYNSTLKEYYMIVGPTSAEGLTGTIRTFMRRYINSSIATSGTSKQVPYGNYYIYELGKKGKDFKPSSTVNGDGSNIDLNPSHYEMPEGVTCSYFTYDEHLKANGNKTYRAKRDGIDITTDDGKIDYYKRIKRYCCSYGSATEGISTIVNYSKIKVRVTKSSDDGKIDNVFFKVQWVKPNGSKETLTWGGTNSEGYIEKWVQAGTYTVSEYGYGPDGGFPSYLELPDPITFKVDSAIVDEYDEVGYYEVHFNNVSKVNIRVHKHDEDNPNKYIDGARYGIYSDTDKLLEELVTSTVTKGNKTYKGFAESKDVYSFGDYYIQEIDAPEGYLKDTTKHYFTIDAESLDRNTEVFPSYSYNFITVGVSETPTRYSFNKVDEDGNPLKGAVLQVISNTGFVVAEWTTDGNDYSIDGKLRIGRTYTLHEKSAPSKDFELAKDITFTVENTSDRQTITMTDKYKRGSVTLHKTDSDGKPLAGAEFELYKSDGTKVTINSSSDGIYEVANSDTNTCVVDSNGTLKVDKLRLGNYYFIETKSPDGYMTNGKKISFSITGESEITLNVDLTVPNNKSFYPDTGGNGYVIPTTIAISIIILSAIGLIALKKKTKKKEK